MRTIWHWLITNLDTIVKFFQLIGIPVAIVIWLYDKRRERRDKDYGTYDTLDDKYIEYLKICLEYPQLDVSDTPNSALATLSPSDQQRELVMFSILISIMERAYLMYEDRSRKVKQEQWDGWKDYIIEWGKRPNFRSALSKLATGFDKRFVAFLHRHIEFEEE